MSDSSAAGGRAVRLERLRVDRAPGIASPFTLELTDRIVVVVGGNGSGKTTTSRAIEAALWPSAGTHHDFSVTAHYTLDGVAWRVHVDGPRAATQRDGQDAKPPTFPGSELRHRYRLSLHELLLAETDGRDFAERILRESRGGYDLESAAAQLGLAPPPSTAGRKEREARDKAREEHRAIAEAQRLLSDRAARLDELRRHVEEARSARARERLLEVALEHARARQVREDAQADLARLDPRMARLNGDELERFEALASREREAGRRLRDAAAAIDRLDEQMRQLLPDGPLPDTLLDFAQRALESLRVSDTQLATASRVASEQERLRQATAQLGDGADEGRLAAIDAPRMTQLTQLARDWADHQAEWRALEGELATLRNDEPPTDPEALRRGIRALEEWLGTPEVDASAGRASLLAIVAAMLTIAAGIASSIAVHPLWSIVAVAGLGVLVLSVVWNRPPADRRPALAEAYQRLGVADPAAWSRDDVAARLDELRRRAGRADLAALHAQRRAGLTARLQSLQPRQAELEAKAQALSALLGVDAPRDMAALLVRAEQIARWQQAHADLRAAMAADEQGRRDVETQRRALAHRLVPFGAGDADGLEELAATVTALDQRARRHAAATHERQTATEARLATDRDRETSSADREALLARLELTDSELGLLSEWIERLPMRRDLVTAMDRAEGRLRQAEHALRAAAGSEVRLLEAAEAELQDELTAASAHAAAYDNLYGEMVAMEQEVRQASAGSSLAEATATLRECEQTLVETRERDAARAVGALLVHYLEERTRDAQRPPVFNAARQLFLAVTDHRWRLDIDDDDTGFRAFDTVDGVGRCLDELSSATRVQLLLAVRLAFVESQEGGGPRLPLLLDETLGTSDDVRAQCIIESVLELAQRTDRQLFYFTAQQDEAAKWMGVLRARGVDGQLVDLAERRRLDRPTISIVAPEPVLLTPLPDPAGMTYEEYGRALHVPALSPELPSVAAVHLWHLADDAAVLHTCLSRRLRYWGQLAALLDSGGESLLADFPEAPRRLRAAARAVAAVLAGAALGRGRPVDREALERSGAVTATFIDRAAELCHEQQGDGRQLIAQIEAGRLSRFRHDAREQLNEFLVTEGYIAQETPLTRDELRQRGLAAVAPEIAAGAVTVQLVERTVSALHRPVSGAVHVAPPALEHAVATSNAELH